jgi:hypothetical protein
MLKSQGAADVVKDDRPGESIFGMVYENSEDHSELEAAFGSFSFRH